MLDITSDLQILGNTDKIKWLTHSCSAVSYDKAKKRKPGQARISRLTIGHPDLNFLLARTSAS